MIKKRKTCLYCGVEMESKTAKKKFCSNLHRVYYHRELARGSLIEKIEPVVTQTIIANKAIQNLIKQSVNTETEARIKQLEKEIYNPPEKFSSSLAKQVYFYDRYKELEQLKSEQ